MITVRIPGEPVAQGRPRAFRTPKGFVRTYDPVVSRSWKGAARHAMSEVVSGAAIPYPEGPLQASILAVFSCPRSQYRKREPLLRRAHAKRPDAENVAKAVLDAATGVLWTDDQQVARLVVEKVIGAQGEAPYVCLKVEKMACIPSEAEPA